jgi:hypothetical protein
VPDFFTGFFKNSVDRCINMKELILFFGVLCSFGVLGNEVDLGNFKKLELSVQTTDNTLPGLQCSGLGGTLIPRGGGPPGSRGFENECCGGLRYAENKDVCGRAYGGHAGVCIACGDKKCDQQFENQCNCPEDCK